jgi:streptogramin lyase
MSISLTTVASTYVTTASMSALRGFGQHPAGVYIPLTGAFTLSSFLNQYPTIQANAGVVTTFATVSTTYGVAVDSAGNVYVADGTSNIRKITPAGVVSTFATGFNSPTGVAVDSAGNVYVTDRSNYTIHKITAGGVVSTLAGLALASGYTDASGSAARFNLAWGIAVDSAGYVYVADSANNVIRKITPAGAVTTLATGFSNPTSVAVDSAGNVYVGDANNHVIRKITAGGVVTTLAGVVGTAGSTDGTGSAARFNTPTGVAVDSAGNVYVADRSNQIIRKITAGGVVTTLAGVVGTPSFGYMDGTGSSARFRFPWGIAVDSAGNVYVADTSNNVIRKIT